MTRVTLGEKVERFYIALRTNELDALVACIHGIEQHPCDDSEGESKEVINEIVQDCRKKAAHFIRIPYAEAVRDLISVSRKKLLVKAAFDPESSQQHGQRHLNTLVDLLGRT
jgi:formylmethanofuran dehydrogenase subunit B